MKTKATLLIGSAMIAVFSCDTKTYSEEDRVEAMNSLNSYVDSVDNAVSILPTHDWSKIENRFENLEDHAEKIYTDLNIEDDQLEETESRFEVIVESGKKEEENFQKTAEMHLDNIENWWNKTGGNVEKTSVKTTEEMEDVTKKSMDWLDVNFEKLGEEAKEEFNKFKYELSKS